MTLKTRPETRKFVKSLKSTVHCIVTTCCGQMIAFCPNNTFVILLLRICLEQLFCPKVRLAPCSSSRFFRVFKLMLYRKIQKLMYFALEKMVRLRRVQLAPSQHQLVQLFKGQRTLVFGLILTIFRSITALGV
jgi:hypothetical protein